MTTARALAIGKMITVWAGFVLLWIVQYAFVVPIVWSLHISLQLGKFAFALGVVGLALLFVPVVGWIILGVLFVNRSNQRRADQRHREMMAALAPETAAIGVAPAHSLIRPWLLDHARRWARESSKSVFS